MMFYLHKLQTTLKLIDKKCWLICFKLIM